MGLAKEVAADRVTVDTGSGTVVLYADDSSRIWKGRAGNSLTVVQPGDHVMVRFRQSPAHPVIVDLFANITHVWGRVTAVSSASFDVDQNFNADPASAYKRITRRIDLSADTAFESSSREDIRPGREVDVIGLETGLETDSGVQATRVVVSEGGVPTRMSRPAVIVAPNGSRRILK